MRSQPAGAANWRERSGKTIRAPSSDSPRRRCWAISAIIPKSPGVQAEPRPGGRSSMNFSDSTKFFEASKPHDRRLALRRFAPFMAPLYPGPRLRGYAVSHYRARRGPVPVRFRRPCRARRNFELVGLQPGPFAPAPGRGDPAAGGAAAAQHPWRHVASKRHPPGRAAGRHRAEGAAAQLLRVRRRQRHRGGAEDRAAILVEPRPRRKNGIRRSGGWLSRRHAGRRRRWLRAGLSRAISECDPAGLARGLAALLSLPARPSPRIVRRGVLRLDGGDFPRAWRPAGGGRSRARLPGRGGNADILGRICPPTARAVRRMRCVNDRRRNRCRIRAHGSAVRLRLLRSVAGYPLPGQGADGRSSADERGDGPRGDFRVVSRRAWRRDGRGARPNFLPRPHLLRQSDRGGCGAGGARCV
ncbi:MAG: hypothetical protein BWZ10_02877 [candidate division BRC1 bacterium ADurb.BinA364]|nr:MAG: hypothetical protein BWZ10_02877 [candidate division BRC1 bacterium ADurb.BinA364]